MEINTIERWKKLREIEAETEAKVWMFVIMVIVILIMLGASLLLVKPVSSHWQEIEPIEWLLIPVFTLAFTLLEIKINPLHWRTRLKVKIFNLVLRRKLRGLEKSEMNFAIDTQEEN